MYCGDTKDCPLILRPRRVVYIVYRYGWTRWNDRQWPPILLRCFHFQFTYYRYQCRSISPVRVIGDRFPWTIWFSVTWLTKGLRWPFIYLEPSIIFSDQSDQSSKAHDLLLQPHDTDSASNHSATINHHDDTDPSHSLATQHLLVRQCRNMLCRTMVRTMHVWQDRASSYTLSPKPRRLKLQLLQCFVHDHVFCSHILDSWSSALDAERQCTSEVWYPRRRLP